VGILLGPASIVHVLIVGFTSLVTAGLWAQFIEGSPSLLRPYGFYGGVVGVFLGCSIVYALGGNVWLLLGAYAVVAPLIQGVGRLRCLVQGCCHGREANASIGIRYRHPRSRVCRLAHLTDVPIHPTPLYSILWNIATVIILARLWSLHVSIPLITGFYLILNGLGRFVEEAYRGEPQTPIVAGLRLYQWTAIASIVVGAGLSMLRSATEIPSPQFSWDALAGAACVALVTTFAVGVDFPDSNRRFSRLA
jgi:prolipoprotein diacylglyceryltransferase